MRASLVAREKRDDVSVKIAAGIYRKAKTIAAYRDVPLAEYLSDLLQLPVEKDYERMRKAMEEEDAGEAD